MTAPSPAAALMDLLAGGLITHAIACAAELRVADRLEAGPRSSDALAEATGAHAPSLYRLLRMLANVGVVVEEEARTFALTPMGRCLCAGEPGSLAPVARYFGHAMHARACIGLPHAVRTGESGFRWQHGDEPFAWLARHPDASAVFHDAMTSTSSLTADAVLAAYDFSRFTAIADVGGGHGHLLARVLEAAPRARGVLLDRPEVVSWARGTFLRRGLADRCTFVGGDFFRAVPDGCDAHLLKNVLHDWGDDAAIAILARCAAVLPRDEGRVLVIEHVVPPRGVASFAALLDLEMLVMSDGGRERTVDEFASLFDAAGLAFSRLVPTSGPEQILEAIRSR